MGESSSPCLVRSFSQPSQERTEADPLRALSTSVSFGRFMSDSLAWEKWSSFTSNRYLEEVEKYAKPGSVAEKKAYFEAQHKKAAAKKAAALLEQQSSAVGQTSNLNVINQNNDHSAANSELTRTSGIKETQRTERDLNVTNETTDDSQMKSEFTENGSCGDTGEAQGEDSHLNVTNPNLDHCTISSESPEYSHQTGIEEVQGDKCTGEAQGEENHLNVTNLNLDHCTINSALPDRRHQAGIEEVQRDKGDNPYTCGSYFAHEEHNLQTAETEDLAEHSSPIENEIKQLDQPQNVDVEVSENIAQLMEKTTQEEDTSTCASYTHEENSFKTAENEIKSLDQPENVDVEVSENIAQLKEKTTQEEDTSTCVSYPNHEENNLKTAETENSIEQAYPVENEVKSLNQPEDAAVEVSENIAQMKKKTQTKNAAMVRDPVLSLKKKPLSLITRLTNNNESSKFRTRVKSMTALQPKVKTPIKNAGVEEDSVLSVKKKPLSSTSRLTSNNESSKFRSRVKPMTALHPKVKAQTKNADIVADSVLSAKKKPLSSTSRLTSKNESSKFRSRVKPMRALQPKVTDKCAPISRKNGKEFIDKRQSNPKSLHISIDSSHKEEMKKLSPILEKIMSSRIVRSKAKTPRDNSKVQQTPATLASVSRISKCSSVTPQQETRNIKSMNKHGSKVCSSPTVFSPFSLRSEERAAKRREFFQKLEQKLNAKEAEKELLQAKTKEKSTSSSKELTSRAKPTARVHHVKESSSNQMKKEKSTSSSKELISRAKPIASVHPERKSSTDQIKMEKATSSSKALTSRAKPYASMHERESTSNHVKKEITTSNSKALTTRAKSNASNHHEKESSSNQMKKMPRQSCSQKFGASPAASEVQDNKPRQPDGSKDVKGENNIPKVKVRSHTSKAGDPTEGMRENASPNIQV